MTSASFPLSAAPRLLAPDLWEKFCGHFQTEESALQSLNSNPRRFLSTMAQSAVRAGQDVDGTSACSVENFERGEEILALVRKAFCGETWLATALHPPSLQRAEIPPCLWSDLSPDFSLSRAKNQDFTFTHVEIHRAVGEPEDRIARCRAWLEQQPRRSKKIMLLAAKDFIPGLLTREFSAAYSAAYDTRVGRPPNSAT